MPSRSGTKLSLKTLGVVVLSMMLGVPAGAQPPAMPSAPSPADSMAEKRISDSFTNLPLTFVENHGQTDAQVRYHAQGSDYAFFFTPQQVVLSLSEDLPVGSKATPRSSVLAMNFIGADDAVELVAQGPTDALVNYVRGDDPGQWNMGLTGYSEIVYDELWPGVDMRLRGQGGELKYEFHVEPGTDPGVIGMNYDGANSLTVNSSGAMQIRTALGILEDSAPVSYQEIDGARVPVASSFRLGEGTAYGFDVGSYQTNQPLVIDPGLDYSTFVGGSSADRAEAITVDANGNAIIAGSTQSTDFPTTVGTVDRTFSGGVMDAFVTKLNTDGSALVYSTYLGGTPTPTRRGTVEETETARDVAVDSAGNAYITGQTSSGDFPVTSGAFQRTLSVGEQTATDGFVTKLGPTGTLQYSTFLGGAASDDGRTIAVDGGGNAYVGGSTFSADFPVTAGAFDTSVGGGEDVFVSKLNSTGSSLVYSTYLGGAENELSAGIAVDSGGNAYLTGSTRSIEFPTTAGSFKPAHSGGGFADLFEVFVTKVNSTGSGLVWSTFLGGTRVDRAAGLAIDGGGNAYVTGGTQSPEFPTTAGAFDTAFNSTSESFVAKLRSDGAALNYSTYLGVATSAAVTVDAGNNAWIGGRAEAGATTTADAHQPTNAGSGDAYIAQLNETGSGLIYATYLGGSDNEFASGIALDPAENIYVTGTTLSSDFPTTPGAFDRLWAGDTSIFWGDAFIAKFGSGTAPPPPPPTDTTAPTVSISAPASGATVSGTTTVSATASDNVGVTEVRFFANGSAIGTDTTAPYSISWNTTTTANGSVNLTATAVDAAGNTGNAAPVAVNVSNSAPPPTTTTSSFSGRIDRNQTLNQTVSSGSGTVTFDLNWTESRADLDLRITNPSGSQVYVNTSNARPKTGTFNATISGDYRFSINNTTDRKTNYTLNVTHPVNSPQAPTDTTAPTVSISQPVNGATVSGTVPVSASATDNVGVSDVRFFVDGILIGTDTTSPYGVSWNTTAVADGAHTLTATARDAAGNSTTSAPVTVTVANTPAPPPADTTAPTVSISAPVSGTTVSGTVSVSANASDNVGVTDVHFRVGNTLIGTDTTSPYGISWDTTTLTDGQHTLTATARDAAGNSTTSAPITVTVNNAPAPPADTAAPTIGISSPTSGATVAGTVTIAATASDNVGVSHVVFYVDGTAVGTDETAPYEISWDTRGSSDGNHILTATAFDAAGNAGNANAVTVTVNNAPPPADTTAPTVSISTPAPGTTVSGSITVSAAASDNVGVREVRFFADGTLIGTDATAPYSISWDTTARANGTVNLTATATDAAGNTGNAAAITITVDNRSPAAALASLSLSPTTVVGGNSSTGTVTLDAAAPVGGVTVALASSNTSAATAPASVTIAEGATGATFTVTTSAVGTNTSSTISATYNGVTRTATLTVTSATTTTNFAGRIEKNVTLNQTVSSGAGTVTFTLNWDESRVDLDLRVTNPSGSQVYLDTGSARPKTGSFTATVPGNYRFSIINNTDRTAEYTLAVTHPAISQ